MENSVLSDAAGVQKNISVMYKEYAQSLGKTTDSLTQAEKAQAVYNGIMNEAAMFTGSAAETAQGYQGVQAQLNASNIELSRNIGESVIPALTQFSSLQLSITQGLTEFTKNHKGATSGMIAFATTLVAATMAMIALKKAKDAYTTSAFAATTATKGFTAALMSNPIFIIATTIATVVSGISMLCSAIKENEEAQAKLNETTEKYKKIKEGTYEYSDKNIQEQESETEKIREQISLLEQKIQKEEEMQRLSEEAEKYSGTGESPNYKKWNELDKQWKQVYKDAKDLEKQFKENQEANGKFGDSIDELNEKINENNKYLTEAEAIQKVKTAMDTETIKKQQQEAAQLKINAKTMQDYLNVIKKGDKSTTEYQEAVKELAKAYPEAANAEGIIIDKAQDYINAEQAKADQAWNTSQTTIKGNIEVINTFIEMARQAENDTAKQQELANAIGISYANIIPTLTSVLNLLTAIGNAAPATVAGVTPVSTKKASGSKKSGGGSYSNKALDDYKKEIEYKKSLDQISLQQEIEMYQIALKKYAKTTDEKRELTTKIYSLQKELQEKGLDDYISNIEYRKSLNQISLQQEMDMYQYAYDNLAKTTEQKKDLEVTLYELRKEIAQKEKESLKQQTKEYERYIEGQKNLRGSEYAINERATDLDKIINIHQNYLNQILHDERLSLEERKEIYEEELDTIRDYEQQKRDLRIENIDNTVSQLTSAITKQIEEMQEADEEAINKNIELIEKWKDTRIDAINEEYDARIKAIQDELDALDKAEEQKTRDEEDTEYEKKKLRLEQLIAYEHDATTKANYEKELAKLIEDHNKTVDKRVLDDKKQALKDQQDILKDEQSAKIDAITQEAERQKEQLQTQLDNIKKYYDKQKELAQQNAQAMLLNVEQNQEQILSLLQNYGDDYEITGQTFGEKLGQGFAETAMQKIQNAISAIQVTIDSAIESNIARLTSLNTKISSGVAGNTVINKTVKVEQNNTITSPVDSPSVAWKKQETLNRNLADSLSRVF